MINNVGKHFVPMVIPKKHLNPVFILKTYQMEIVR